MSAPFTPDQEARLRELIDAAVDMAVVAGAGDTPRLLTKLQFMRIAHPTGEPLSREALLTLADTARAESNAAAEIRSLMPGEA